MLAGQIGARGRTCTCTGDVLDVVPLHWATRAMDGASRRSCTDKISLQKKSAGCCREQGWSQSPVLPRARLAYDACLNAGSTAVLAHGHHSKTGAPIGLHAVGAHGRICTGTVRVLRAPSLHWTTWAKWCRVRDFHPQPLRSERSVSCSWTNAA